ncbi:MAG: FAD-binding oxidoreductase [Bauldia sp.]
MPRKSRTSLAGWRPGGEPDPLARARRAERWLADTLGLPSLTATPAAAFDPAPLPVSRIDRDTLAHLTAAVGSPADIDPFSRADHALGQSYPDVLRRRSGKIEAAPDAVLSPPNREAVMQVMRIAGDKGLAVIPFGGGTSAVGGVSTPAIPGAPVIVLDMRGMDRVIAIDAHDVRATAEAGIAGPALASALGAQGVTLGHTPESFEYSTLGGWIAAGGVGEHSNLYGRARDWFVSARIATPQGIWSSEDGGTAGPALGDLIVGSEGTLGVILDATFRIHPIPAVTDCRGFAFADFAAGCEAVRQLAQSGIPVATLRLADEDETHFVSTLAAMRRGQRLRARIGRTMMRLRRVPERHCLAIVGLEGAAITVARARHDIDEIMRRHKGIDLGERPGTAWLASRYQAPGLRDALLDRGLGFDTIETAAAWSKLPALRQGVGKAIADAMAASLAGGTGRGFVMCRLGHSGPGEASLTFTFVFPRKTGAEMEQWHAIRHAAGRAILEGGGTASHHYGSGTGHVEDFGRENGNIAASAQRAVKGSIDPAGIMNPGKLGLPT